jgi:hypothetical protein
MHRRGAARCPSHSRSTRSNGSEDFAVSSNLTPRLQEEIRKEAQTMSLLNHPNLVSCYRSFVNGPVRSLAASERAALGLTRLAAVPEPLGHHAVLLGRLRAQYHEVRLPASARAAVLRRQLA